MSTFDIDKVVAAYLECAIWLGITEDETPYDDAGFKVDNIDPESRQQAREDCARFCRENESDLLLSELDDEQIGHDFWLTRNGHGAGFWSRVDGIIGDRLSEACEKIGEAYLWDDGEQSPETGILTVY